MQGDIDTSIHDKVHGNIDTYIHDKVQGDIDTYIHDLRCKVTLTHLYMIR